MSNLTLRQRYHDRICEEIIRVEQNRGIESQNSADIDSGFGHDIAWGIANRIGCSCNYDRVSEPTIEKCFVDITKDYLERVFETFQNLHQAYWYFPIAESTSLSDQYRHLSDLETVIGKSESLISALSKANALYPNIVIGRCYTSDEGGNFQQLLVSTERPTTDLIPLQSSESSLPRCILHASISCKWTIRSDRSQNARSEALNLIRNRKGRLPHIVAVTAEPMPTRIASLALGTGDLDCVYHFALHEMQQTLEELGNEDQLDMLNMLVEGRRLRDISDLPFDLVT
ncbi:MAG: restriction endonuclease [Anaerolineae bacterium]|nr:restriction endonuclease [Anaerolineae bacterium]